MDLATAERLLGPAPRGSATTMHTNLSSEPPKPVKAGEKVGRNDVCPCGSGKKYKKCHGAAEG
jgi:preprotein translocase subunit SecA